MFKVKVKIAYAEILFETKTLKYNGNIVAGLYVVTTSLSIVSVQSITK
jgi:hypothetical protein